MSVLVTYLEMGEAPARPPGPAPNPGARIARVLRPGLESYRFLYQGVGQSWLWSERSGLDDRDLAAILQDPAVELLVLSQDRRIAGFAELDRRKPPDVRLAYLGLLSAYLGRGLGRWLLSHAIHRAWSTQPRRLLVNTCTFDHPAALALYRSAGFRAIRSVLRRIPDPRLAGLLPLTAAPHIPLAVDSDDRRF